MNDDKGLTEEHRDSSVRWQQRTMDQLGYTLNLILGLAVAALGFEISLMLARESHWAEWQNYILLISLIVLLVSVAIGLSCVLNRLYDFRKTAEIARKREDGVSNTQLQSLRANTRKFGKLTWFLLKCHIVTFGTGILLLVVAVAAEV